MQTEEANKVTAPPRSYKVGVKTTGDDDWCYNALRFKTEKAAREWGSGLFMRWTAVQEYEVHPSEDDPNQAE